MDNDTYTDEPGTRTLTVPAAAVSVIRDRVAKLTARIAKRGLAGDVTLTVGDAREVRSDGPIQRIEVVHDVTITVAPVALPGNWRLAGTIDFATAAPNVLLNSVGDFTLPESFRTVSVCDHCDRRIRRNKLIVVADSDGTLVRVGTTCVRDYLGVNPADLLWYVNASADLLDEPDEGWASGGSWGWDTLDVVRAAMSCVRLFGWKPASFDGSTKAFTSAVLNPTRYEDDEIKVARHEAFDGRYTDEATRIVEWVRSIDPSGNDYLMNLTAVLDNDWVRPKGLGLAVSVVQAWGREQGRVAERKAREAAEGAIPDAWIGEEGGKVTVTGTVTRFHCYDSDYGTRAIIVVATDRGWVKVFTGCETKFADAADAARKTGEQITVTGTVKDHDMYEGRRETVLTRCKAVAA